MRSIKVGLAFKYGAYAVVRVLKANDNEFILSNGMTVKIFDHWKVNTVFPLNADGCVDYKNTGSFGNDVYAIIKQGRFIGILASIHSTQELFATNVRTGRSALGWSSGNINDYCKMVVADSFGAESEFLEAIESSPGYSYPKNDK